MLSFFSCFYAFPISTWVGLRCSLLDWPLFFFFGQMRGWNAACCNLPMQPDTSAASNGSGVNERRRGGWSATHYFAAFHDAFHGHPANLRIAAGPPGFPAREHGIPVAYRLAPRSTRCPRHAPSQHRAGRWVHQFTFLIDIGLLPFAPIVLAAGRPSLPVAVGRLGFMFLPWILRRSIIHPCMLYHRLKRKVVPHFFRFPPFFFYGTHKYFGRASMALRRTSFENGRRVLCIIVDGRHGPATISLSVSRTGRFSSFNLNLPRLRQLIDRKKTGPAGQPASQPALQSKWRALLWTEMIPPILFNGF